MAEVEEAGRLLSECFDEIDDQIASFRRTVSASEDVEGLYEYFKSVATHLVGDKRFTPQAIAKLSRVIWTLVPAPEAGRQELQDISKRLVKYVCELTRARLVYQRVAALILLRNAPLGWLDRETQDEICTTVDECARDKAVLVKKEAASFKDLLKQQNITKREKTRGCAFRYYEKMMKLAYRDTKESCVIKDMFEGKPKTDTKTSLDLEFVKTCEYEGVTPETAKRLFHSIRQILDDPFSNERSSLFSLAEYLTFVVGYSERDVEYEEKIGVLIQLMKTCRLLKDMLEYLTNPKDLTAYLAKLVMFVLQRKPSSYHKALALVKLTSLIGAFIRDVYGFFSEPIDEEIYKPLIPLLKGKNMIQSDRLVTAVLFSEFLQIDEFSNEIIKRLQEFGILMLEEGSTGPDPIVKKEYSSTKKTSVLKTALAPLHIIYGTLCAMKALRKDPKRIMARSMIFGRLLELPLETRVNVEGYAELLAICPSLAVFVMHEAVGDLKTDIRKIQDLDIGLLERQFTIEENATFVPDDMKYSSVAIQMKQLESMVESIMQHVTANVDNQDILGVIESESLIMVGLFSLLVLMMSDRTIGDIVFASVPYCPKLLSTLIFCFTYLLRCCLWRGNERIQMLSIQTTLSCSALSQQFSENPCSFVIGVASTYVSAKFNDIDIDDTRTGCGDRMGWGLATLACFVQNNSKVDKEVAKTLLGMPDVNNELCTWSRAVLKSLASKGMLDRLLCKEVIAVVAQWEAVETSMTVLKEVVAVAVQTAKKVNSLYDSVSMDVISED